MKPKARQKTVREEVADLILGADSRLDSADNQASIAFSLLAIAKLLNEVTSGGDKLHISDGTFRGV